MQTRILLAAFAAFLFLPIGAAQACGEDSDCDVSDGNYRISIPPTASGEHKPGAIVFLHGYGATPEATMGFKALRDVADRLGVALIVPRGLNKSWSLPGAFRSRRDDVAFIRSVVEDATSRFAIDPDRILVTGFSVGGSMTWYVACAEGRRYAGYAPIAGSFWEPYVDNCKLPLANIYHVHGLADTTVPLAGRSLSVAVQGDTFKSFSLLRKFSSCTGELEGDVKDGELICSRQSCGGAVQELCLHPGGHSVKPAWIERAWHKLALANGWS